LMQSHTISSRLVRQSDKDAVGCAEYMLPEE
jgi:hypothetical protein